MASNTGKASVASEDPSHATLLPVKEFLDLFPCPTDTRTFLDVPAKLPARYPALPEHYKGHDCDYALGWPLDSFVTKRLCGFVAIVQDWSPDRVETEDYSRFAAQMQLRDTANPRYLFTFPARYPSDHPVIVERERSGRNGEAPWMMMHDGRVCVHPRLPYAVSEANNRAIGLDEGSTWGAPVV